MNAKTLIFFSTVFAIFSVHAQDFGASDPVDAIGMNFEHLQLSEPNAVPRIGISEQKGGVSVPVYRGSTTALVAFLRGQNISFTDKVAFKDATIDIPRNVRAAEAGTTWSRSDPMGKSSVSVIAGSKGREPFVARVLTVNASCERLQPNGDAWIYFLNYSNNRSVLNNVPLPGIAYAFNGDNYRLVLGVPIVSFFWRPMPVMFLFTLSPLGGFSELSSFVFGPLQLYTNIGWLPRSFAGLDPQRGDRFVYDKKEWGVGIKLYLGPKLNFSAGYLQGFDRRLFVGKNIYEASSERIHLADAGGWQVKLKATF